MYSISKEFSIEYGHRLQLPYESQCKNIHGHSARIIIKVGAHALNNESMIVDFSELKDFQKTIEDMFDHALILNGNDPFVKLLEKYTKIHTLNSEPTAEALANYISRSLTIFLDVRNIIFARTEVTFYETAKNCASFTYHR